jgi:hypothetical protein
MKTARLLVTITALGLCCHTQAATQAGALGKLFLTPEKRQMLDRQRDSNLRESESVESETLQLDGVVQRSSGRHSVWINQRMQSESDKGLSVGVQRRSPATADIAPAKEPATRLRVGESLDRGTGQRQDVVPPGGVSIGNVPP